MTDLSVTDSLCHALLIEYLKRKGLSKTLTAYTDEHRGNGLVGISSRSELAKSLHLTPAIRLNHENGGLHVTLLEMLVSSLHSNSIKLIRLKNTSTHKNGEVTKEEKSTHNNVTERSQVSVVQEREKSQGKENMQSHPVNIPTHPEKLSIDGFIVPDPTMSDLAQLLFRRNTSKLYFGEEWRQGFYFVSSYSQLRYGLIQRKGGPCGVISVVQAYILKELLYSLGESVKDSLLLNVRDEDRELALLNAISYILIKTSGTDTVTLITIPKELGEHESISNQHLNMYKVSKTDLLTFLKEEILPKWRKEYGLGVICFLLSVVMSKGIDKIRSEMDDKNNTLIAVHGYCSQELVNLLLTGHAVSNVFNGDKEVDGMTLHGVSTRCEIGYLTNLEKFHYVEVGSNFKTPVFPIWITNFDSHYTVLYSISGIIPEEGVFDLYFYDELANSNEQYKITVDMNQSPVLKDDVIPLEDTIHTRWLKATCDWNGSEPLL